MAPPSPAESPTRPSAAKKVAAALLFAAAGLALGYFAAKLGFQAGRGEGRAAGGGVAGALAFAGLAVLGAWLALVFHETGHVLGGLSQGFRFLFLAAGPLWVERRDGRLAVRFNTTSATWGGLAACVPDGGADLSRRFAVMVAGGPLASLLLALLAGGLWALAPVGAPRFAAAVVALSSAGFFLATAQPFGAGAGFASDGGRLRTILRGGALAARESALLAITAAAMGGTRPRDWPPALVAGALEPADGSMMEVAALAYAAQAEADRGSLDAARDLLERADRLAAGSGPLLRSAIAAEAAWLAAALGDAARGRELLAHAEGPFTERYLLHRARAAVLLAEGDRAGARAEAEEGLASIPRARFGRPSARERELLDGLRAASEVPPAGQRVLSA